MSSFGGRHTVKRWTCSDCDEAGISNNVGDCPNCQHARCIDCDLRIYKATDAEIEEEDLKAARAANRDGSQHQSAMPQRAEGSTSSSERAYMHGSSQNPSAMGLAAAIAAPEGCVLQGDQSLEGPLDSWTHLSSREAQPHQSDRVPGRDPSPSPTEQAGSSIEGDPRANHVADHSTLLPVATGTENHPIFILRDGQDARLIAMWNTQLRSLSENCGTRSKDLVSIHLFRMGTDEPNSIPTVLINTSQPLDETTKRGMQYIVTDKLDSAPHSIQIVFRQSRLRRSINSVIGFSGPVSGPYGSGPDPPICQPRNIDFYETPGTGASIGIAGSLQDTATLGCYLLVDNKPMILTVDHLIPESGSESPVITHVSEQDQNYLLTLAAKEFITRYNILPSNHRHDLCNVCSYLYSPLLDVRDLPFFNRQVACGDPISCPVYHETINYLSKEAGLYRAVPFARIYARSGRRCRSQASEPLTTLPREMDWALFEVFEDKQFGSDHCRPQFNRHESPSQIGDPYLHETDVIPGAFIKSVGRTSGDQIGQISNTACVIFHDDYQTQEWSILRRQETSINEWIEGGIGVDGDSGGIIVDEKSNSVYGMLWGRSGDGPATVTLFTPLKEIFIDITERNRAPVEILCCQEMLQPNTKARRDTTTLPSELESAPEMMVIDETRQDMLSELTIPTPGVRRLSSIEVGHRPFERYRGHDRRHRSVPRSMTNPNDEDVAEGGQYPGSYTYTRYALEQEKED